MQFKQPTKLCKPRRKMRVKVDASKNRFKQPQYLLLAVPRRYFRYGFICFMFGVVQFLNVLILTLLCVQFIYYSKVN